MRLCVRTPNHNASRAAKHAVAVSLLAVFEAGAQVLLCDDFDGDSLLPNWIQPQPEDWEYTVDAGALHVTGLSYPSIPQTPLNFAFLMTFF